MRERLPAGDEPDLRRHYSRRALAVGAVQLSLAGELAGVGRHDRWALEDAVHEHLARVTDPHLTGGRTGALADALLEHVRVGASEGPAAALASEVALRGVAHLLRQPSTDGTSESEGDDLLLMSPAECLTARYAAPGRPALDWQARLATLPAAELVAAADRDQGLDQAGHLAVLALLGQMRTEIERLEDTALARAHAAGTSWSRIGTALGITKQSAHARAKRRAAGRPTRSSGQP